MHNRFETPLSASLGGAPACVSSPHPGFARPFLLLCPQEEGACGHRAQLGRTRRDTEFPKIERGSYPGSRVIGGIAVKRQIKPSAPCKLDRRSFLQGSAAAVGGAVAAPSRTAARGTGARVLELRTISQSPAYYHGWPTVARRGNGTLILVYSGGREAHVCPFGRVEMMISRDDGRTWGFPQVLLDSAIDDRDSGVLETLDGTLLVTTFTSLAFEPVLEKALSRGPGGTWTPERLHRWQSARDRLTPAERKSELGEWMVRSTDGGLTWSQRYRTMVNSPHGPFQLRDKRILYAGKELWTDATRVGVCESRDDGRTWNWLAEIPARPGDRVDAYHELHGVETPAGQLVVHIRNHNPSNDREILQSESFDGGRTWSEPRPIGVWGLPSHLLRLSDGRILMSYGYRRAPFGVHARISGDSCRNWSEPLVVSDDGASGDLGYPSTVELPDRSMLTAWYELPANSTLAVLRQARWRLGP